MTTMLKTFIADESGAVTIDWVVLAAAIVAITIGFVNDIGTRVNNVSVNMSDNVHDGVDTLSKPTIGDWAK